MPSNSLRVLIIGVLLLNVLSGQSQNRVTLSDTAVLPVSNSQIAFLNKIQNSERLDQILRYDVSDWIEFNPNLLSVPYRNYWFKIEVVNASSVTLNWILYVGRNDEIDVHIVKKQTTQKEFAGYLRASSVKSLKGDGYSVPISLNKGEEATLFIRTREVLHEDPDLAPMFQTTAKYWKATYGKQRGDNVFLGVVFIMLFYSAFVYLSSREKANIFYSLYLLSLTLVFLFLTGILRQEIIAEYPEYTRFGMLAVPLAAAFYFLFVQAFLDIKNLLPKWSKWFRIVIRANFAFSVIGLLSLYFFGMLQTSQMMQVLIIANCTLILLVLVRVIKLRNPINIYYALGTSCFLIAVFFDSILWDVNETNAIIVRIGLVGEILFYSVGLGTRLKREQAEKQKVHQELISQLKVNQELLENRESELEELVERRTEKLRALNEELKAYDQMISHDLKGPVTNIQAMAQFMVSQAEFNSTLYESAQKINNQADRSMNLIKSILDFSVTDQLSLDDVTIDLNEILSDVINGLNDQILDGNVQLTVNHLPALSKGVRVKIYQLFYNLMSNAVKFRREGSGHNIQVITEENPEVIKILFEDNGIGFDKSEVGKIFEPKHRGDKIENVEGQGIGLATCKRIVVMHGWGLMAEPREPYGARFTVSIPIRYVQL